jgi:hypothetical protein
MNSPFGQRSRRVNNAVWSLRDPGDSRHTVDVSSYLGLKTLALIPVRKFPAGRLDPPDTKRHHKDGPAVEATINHEKYSRHMVAAPGAWDRGENGAIYA